MTGALPNLVVIGAMKCGTTALHRYLDLHPDVAMAAAKEVNFFTGPGQPPPGDPDDWWQHGQWHRGAAWYASLFDAACPVRGEASPGYTSPDHPLAAGRMASVVPDARLVCLVRDPFTRALSQYQHHRRDGGERRPVEEALLDSRSQYLARGRYHERLAPFRRHFAREQLLVVVTERLATDRRAQLQRVFAHVGADPDWWRPALDQRWHVGTRPEPHPDWLRRAVHERVHDDVERLREELADALPEWRA